MSIYNEVPPMGAFLKLKEIGTANIRFFGEPIMFQKVTNFNEKKEEKTRFATLCLYRNPQSKESEVKVFEFGWTVQKQLGVLNSDEDWGDPTGYDIQVKRQGEGLQTEYFITPRQKKPLSDADSALIAANTIDLRKAVNADGKDQDSYNPYADE